jgi:hypothetical protein
MAWATPTRPQSITRLGFWSPAILLAALPSQTFALSIAVLGLCDGLALRRLKPWLILSIVEFHKDFDFRGIDTVNHRISRDAQFLSGDREAAIYQGREIMPRRINVQI